MIINPGLGSFNGPSVLTAVLNRKTTADFMPSASPWGTSSKGGTSWNVRPKPPVQQPLPMVTWATAKPPACNCGPAVPAWNSLLGPAIPKTPSVIGGTVSGGVAGALARVMSEKAGLMAQRQPAFSGFGAFGYNEDYCDKTYPTESGDAQMIAWNTKCKKGCSGLSCLSNPGLAASPWTILGKNSRGLPDDSLLGTALQKVKGLIPGKTPSGTPQGGPSGYVPSGPSFMDSPYFMPVALAAVAGVVLWKMKRK